MEQRCNKQFMFVVDKQCDEVVAVSTADNQCYSHLGQHSSYTPGWVVESCRKATRREYFLLLCELIQVGYNVDILNDKYEITDLFRN